jgi:hypothetical protein
VFQGDDEAVKAWVAGIHRSKWVQASCAG